MGGEDAKLSSKRKQESGPHFPSLLPRETYRKAFSMLQENSYLVKFDIKFVCIFSATAILLEIKTCIQ